MRTYTPDRWVVLEMTHGDDVTKKVFGGWYGGYAGADSWKLSSGITETKEFADYYEFTNVSGSVYVCHKQAEGFSAYMVDIYSGWEREMEKDTSGITMGFKLIDYGDAVENPRKDGAYHPRYKGELMRIAIQCGNTDHEAIRKFIKIISKRIDAAYEMGKVDGAKDAKLQYDLLIEEELE